MSILDRNIDSREAEAYKMLRTNIQYSSQTKNLKTFLITSATLKEGKSSICCNLGVAFSEVGKSVVIIDCDFRNSKINKLFNISTLFGLSEILLDEVKLEDAINCYNSNLDIITSGKMPLNPSQILGSRKMDDLLNYLSETYDIIILDSPPIDIVSDAQILSTKVDGTIMVVMAGKTKSKKVRDAVKILRSINSNIIGIVLNGIEGVGYKDRDYYNIGKHKRSHDEKHIDINHKKVIKG